MRHVKLSDSTEMTPVQPLSFNMVLSPKITHNDRDRRIHLQRTELSKAINWNAQEPSLISTFD